MPANTKINYIEFPAADLDAAQAFYEKAFGWTFTDYGPEYKAFNDGVMDGGFYKADMKSDSDQGAALVVLYSEQLESVEKAVSAHGGEIVKPIFSFPGGRRFHFTDPNGNELAVWSE